MITSRRHFIALGTALMTAPHIALANAPLNVVATTGMIADTVRQIGGTEVQVRALMGPGVDPHAYRQTRSDIAAMTQADVPLSRSADGGVFAQAGTPHHSCGGRRGGGGN